jgi:hypothetical protein
MNINLDYPETLTVVKKFIGYTLDEKEFYVYAEWDIDTGWFVHGVMFADTKYNERQEEIDEVTNFFYKNIQ